LEFTFRAKNIEGFKIAARRIVLDDYTPLWPYAAQPITNMWVNIFNTQGASGAHGAWAELDPDYAERKRRKYGSKPILQASGKLFTAGLSSDAFEYEPRRMRFTIAARSRSGFPYPVAHQTGFETRLGKGGHGQGSLFGRLAGRLGARRSQISNLKSKMAHVPARRVLDPTDRDRQAIQRAFAAGYVTILRKMGYRMAKEQGLGSVSPSEAVSLGRGFFQQGTGIEAAL
jgi:hypothetical protein